VHVWTEFVKCKVFVIDSYHVVMLSYVCNINNTVTFNMLFQFAMAYANISSLHARWEDISKKFFRKILTNPDNPLFDLLPPPQWHCYYGTTPISPPVPCSEDTYLQALFIYTSQFDPLPAKLK